MDQDGNSKRKQIIIAPITIKEKSKRTIRIGWSCSHHQNCHNPTCHYSTRKKKTTHLKPPWELETEF